MNTKEIFELLSAPFAPNVVKWKIQTNPRDLVEVDTDRGKRKEGDALVVAYIDARDVMDRLDEVLPLGWSTFYKVLKAEQNHVAVDCHLTLSTGEDTSQVSHADVGEGGEYKDAYSDALKRAAVHVGVGRFLYHFPKVKARAYQYGSAYYLTKQAERDLLVLTEAMLAGDARLPKLDSIKVNGYQPFVKGIPL